MYFIYAVTVVTGVEPYVKVDYDPMYFENLE